MVTRRMKRSDRGQQLLDIAEGLFTTVGFESTTFEQIAREAEVSRPVIYQHYASKDDLLIACAQRALAEFQVSVAAAHQKAGGDLELFLRLGGEELFTLLAEQPGRWALLFSDAIGSGSTLGSQLSDLRFATADGLALLAAPHLPSMSAEQLGAAANSVAGLAEALCRWSVHHGDIPQERLVEYFTRYALAVLRGPHPGPA